MFLFNQPFEQFEIFILFSLCFNLFNSTFFVFNFTNYFFYLVVVTFILSIPLFFNNSFSVKLLSNLNFNFFYSPYRLVSTKVQLLLEKFYIFIFELVYQQV